MNKKEYIKSELKRLEEVLTLDEERLRNLSYDYIRFAIPDAMLYEIHKSSESLKWRGHI